MNLIDSHPSLQTSHNCKLNFVAWVIEFMYLHLVVKCKSLLSGHDKVHCTVIDFKHYYFYMKVNYYVQWKKQISIMII